MRQTKMTHLDSLADRLVLGRVEELLLAGRAEA